MIKRTVKENSPIPAGWLSPLRTKVRPPVCIALGSPRQVADFLQVLSQSQAVVFQLDLHQAERCQELLEERKLPAEVKATADLWDLPAEFQTVLFLVEPRGERMLKLDIIEQGYHVLKPGGTMIVLSRNENDQFFPGALKKIYGRVHAPATGEGGLLWCQRGQDRSRRRHEVTFHVSRTDGPSLQFISRPGVFSYGRFDNGARALVETAVITPGDRILDLGCGCGSNGIICGLRGGPDSHVTFVDSNCRAVALADLNARANGLAHFDLRPCFRLERLPPDSFDVVLANPPYFANLEIAERFIAQSRPLLKEGGRFYLVTKQPLQVGPMVAEHFGGAEVVERRGYVVLSAQAE